MNHSTNHHDISEALQAQVSRAAASKEKLNIKGGNSKAFLGLINPDAAVLDVSQHTGTISHEPTELVITARAGTRLEDIKQTLKAHYQTLAFEPPAYGHDATIGGTIACALAGPAKPYFGGARDYILGCTVLTGHGQILKFGGEVMKNVAGYDVSRLMTGAMGTLGVLLDVSLKVLPATSHTTTLISNATAEEAIEQLQALGGMGLPVTASAWHNNKMYTRLAGSAGTVAAAAEKLPGSESNEPEFWLQLREHTLPFFTRPESRPESLWRISVPALTPPLSIAGEWLYDWAGMQRWLVSSADANDVRNACSAVGGNATLFRADKNMMQSTDIFQPLPVPLMKLHRRLKQEFDPEGVFNYQRLFPEF